MKNNYFNVAELIESPSALTREQGSVVYNVIVPLLRNGENITLDFADVESLITPFLNVVIGKLYEDFSSEQLNDQLKISNLPEGTRAKFKLVIENAKKYYTDKELFEKNVEEAVSYTHLTLPTNSLV